MDSIFIETVAKALKINPGKLKEDSGVDSIPEWDSLTHWSIIGSLENRYGVEFTMDEVIGLRNLRDIYDKLMEKKRGHEAGI